MTIRLYVIVTATGFQPPTLQVHTDALTAYHVAAAGLYPMLTPDEIRELLNLSKEIDWKGVYDQAKEKIACLELDGPDLFESARVDVIIHDLDLGDFAMNMDIQTAAHELMAACSGRVQCAYDRSYYGNVDVEAPTLAEAEAKAAEWIGEDGNPTDDIVWSGSDFEDNYRVCEGNTERVCLDCGRPESDCRFPVDDSGEVTGIRCLECGHAIIETAKETGLMPKDDGSYVPFPWGRFSSGGDGCVVF